MPFIDSSAKLTGHSNLSSTFQW